MYPWGSRLRASRAEDSEGDSEGAGEGNGLGARFDPYKLLVWSWSDVPMVLAGLAAVLSWASTPELPVPRAVDHTIQTALKQQKGGSCRQAILEFNTSVGVAARQQRVTHVPPIVRALCHAPMDVSHPRRLHIELQRRQKQRNAEAAADGGGQPPPPAIKSWRHSNIDLATPMQSLVGTRPPQLGYILLISPTDSPLAVSKLVQYIWAHDNAYVLHVDAKVCTCVRTHTQTQRQTQIFRHR